MRKTILTVTMLLICPTMAPTVTAEVFYLQGGGEVSGKLLNPDQSPRKSYVVEVAEGSKVTLDAAQVERVVRPRSEEIEYERIRPTFADTATAQWELAQWCREHGLMKQRISHLQRVVELDPQHVEARHALGYSQVDGQWVTRDDLMTQRGYRKYKGQWKTQQEIDLIENKHDHEIAQQEWFQKLKRWRSWLGSDRDQQGRENIQTIKDPLAVKALTAALRDDGAAEARLLYIEALAAIDDPDAANALAIASLFDEVEEIRLTCLDHLEVKKRPEVVSYYVGKLKDKENYVVNRAAFALARMKDTSSIRPLIDALITVHKYKISKPGGDGAMSSTFGSGPGGAGGGMSMGGGPKIVRQEMSNQTVLDALVALTGQNFNFDKQAWKYWLAAQKKSEKDVDARRD